MLERLRFWSYRHAKNHTSAEVDELREALDDLWGAIRLDEIEYLQPETVDTAKRNHTALWHLGEEQD